MQEILSLKVLLIERGDKNIKLGKEKSMLKSKLSQKSMLINKLKQEMDKVIKLNQKLREKDEIKSVKFVLCLYF